MPRLEHRSSDPRSPLGALSTVYRTVARWRRRWYLTHPEARRQLRRPVVSIGGLSVGGSGKTPVAAEVARLLAADGERPAVLSRGYGRQRREDGVVVVSDRGVVRAGVEVSGDEPLMLARQVTEASVLVAEDRYLAGVLAESRLGATVHVLDDGFQHLRLHRDVDVLVMASDDLSAMVLPAGRLREGVDAAIGVDAVVVDVATDAETDKVGRSLRAGRAFRMVRALERPRTVGSSQPAPMATGSRSLVVAGIARPEAFVDALRDAGYDVVDSVFFRDHHIYTPRDVERLRARLQALGAQWVLTTEKDSVRMQSDMWLDLPIVWVPLRVTVEPKEAFRVWLSERLDGVRRARCADQLVYSSRAGEPVR